MQPTLLILAAGIGSRYGGLKQVDGMGPGGAAILEYSVYDAIRAGFGKVVFVIRKDIEEAFREKVGSKVESKIEVAYAFQEADTALEWLETKPYREKPWGTGHAILSAKDVVAEPFVAINADDFYGPSAFQLMGDFLRTDCAPDRYGMVAYQLGNTLSENGAVSRGVCEVNAADLLTDVTERTKIERFEDGIFYIDETSARNPLADNTPVSMNFWGFHPTVFQELEEQFRAFVLENMDKPKAEFYIPKVVNTLIENGKVTCSVMTSDSQWYGVTYPEDKETVQGALAAMATSGVYPESL
ncbi:MAG: nucleotidyltransferase [Saprospiraceae bacterium]|nr:nucleotidyltransferase [Saprospiraceae bacterium]